MVLFYGKSDERGVTDHFPFNLRTSLPRMLPSLSQSLSLSEPLISPGLHCGVQHYYVLFREQAFYEEDAIVAGQCRGTRLDTIDVFGKQNEESLALGRASRPTKPFFEPKLEATRHSCIHPTPARMFGPLVALTQGNCSISASSKRVSVLSCLFGEGKNKPWTVWFFTRQRSCH